MSKSALIPKVILRTYAELRHSQKSGDEEIFLSNALLENGHAIRKESYSLSDWENAG